MQTDETKRQVPGRSDSEHRGATWTWSRYPGTAKPRSFDDRGRKLAELPWRLCD
jgi:hypothetical protein